MKSQRLEIGLSYPAFANHPEAPAQGMGGSTFHSELNLPVSIINQKMPPQTSWWGHFLKEGFSPPVKLDWVKLTKHLPDFPAYVTRNLRKPWDMFPGTWQRAHKTVIPVKEVQRSPVMSRLSLQSPLPILEADGNTDLKRQPGATRTWRPESEGAGSDTERWSAASEYGSPGVLSGILSCPFTGWDSPDKIPLLQSHKLDSPWSWQLLVFIPTELDLGSLQSLGHISRCVWEDISREN